MIHSALCALSLSLDWYFGVESVLHARVKENSRVKTQIDLRSNHCMTGSTPSPVVDPHRAAIACFNCGRVGHLRAMCPDPPRYMLAQGGRGPPSRPTTAPPSSIACYRCQGPGHIARDCTREAASVVPPTHDSPYPSAPQFTEPPLLPLANPLYCFVLPCCTEPPSLTDARRPLCTQPPPFSPGGQPSTECPPVRAKKKTHDPYRASAVDVQRLVAGTPIVRLSAATAALRYGGPRGTPSTSSVGSVSGGISVVDEETTSGGRDTMSGSSSRPLSRQLLGSLDTSRSHFAKADPAQEECAPKGGSLLDAHGDNDSRDPMNLLVACEELPPSSSSHLHPSDEVGRPAPLVIPAPIPLRCPGAAPPPSSFSFDRPPLLLPRRDGGAPVSWLPPPPFGW